MIKPGEIQSIAGKKGVRDTQIEKDYVISWITYGIAKNPFLNRNLIFKGGTVLKKVYFPDYRFSEDLDFSFNGSNFNINDIKAAFNELIAWVYEESRVSLSIQNETQHETGNFNFYLAYTGPLGGAGVNKDIKVDISQDIEDHIFAFQAKAKYKGYDPNDLVKVIEQKKKIFAKHWNEHLADQMTVIPDFTDVWRELGKHWRRFQKFIG